MNNLEQRKRVQEINAKIAMLCDYNRDLRGDITANTLEISGLLDERDKIGSGELLAQGGCNE